MHRILGIVAFGVGGLLVSLVLRQPTDELLFTEGFGGSQLHVLYDSVVATATLGVIVAVLVAGFVLERTALTVVSAVGLVVIGMLAILGGTSLTVQYAMSIAAGAVLGGLARLSRDRPESGRRASLPMTALATGVIVGVLLGRSLRGIRFSHERPRRYADYLPAPHSYLTGPSDLLVAALAAIAVGALLAYLTTGGSRIPAVGPAPARVAVIGGCLLPVTALVAHWWLRESMFSEAGIGLHTWAFGYLLLAPALVLALLLPARSGLLWVAIAAVVAAAAVSSPFGSESITALIALVVALIGAVAGRVVARPLWGTAVLGLCTLLAFTGDSVVALAALLFVVPMAAAFTVVSSLPSSETVTASALGIPTVLVATVGVQYGWTAYTPLTDADGLNFFTISGNSTLILSTVALVACMVVTVIIGRRPVDPLSGPIAAPPT